MATEFSFKNNLKAELYENMTASQTTIKLKHLVNSSDPAVRLAAWPRLDSVSQSHPVSFFLTLEDKISGECEIITCTDVYANTDDYIQFVCARGMDGTTAAVHPIDTTMVENREVSAFLNNLSNIYWTIASGDIFNSVVSLATNQTISGNKIFSGTVNFTNTTNFTNAATTTPFEDSNDTTIPTTEWVMNKVGAVSRNIGEIFYSLIPLVDANIHLLNGGLIYQEGIYQNFVNYMVDLYEDGQHANLFCKGYTYHPKFEQPILTANGTLGGDSFACQASSEYSASYPAWYAFDSSLTTEWASSGFVSNSTWILFYNPKALNVTKLTLRNRTVTQVFTSGSVYGSNDNSEWTEIKQYTNSVTAANAEWEIDLSSNTEFYKYYKIVATTITSDNPGFTNIKITATTEDTITVSPEEQYLQSIHKYGVCGKFVWDSVNKTLRLPKVTGFIQGTIVESAIGDLVEAGLPNITGNITSSGSGLISPALSNELISNDGVIQLQDFTSSSVTRSNVAAYPKTLNFDASRSSSIYGNSNTVQPQAIKGYIYIVLANAVKTQIEVDIDNVATDVNNAVSTAVSAKDTVNSIVAYITETWHDANGNWYRVWSDGWCEQGGNMSGTNKVVYLFKPYINTNYTIQTTGTDVSPSDGCFTSCFTDRTTNSFKFWQQYGSSAASNEIVGCWEAKGYIS